MNNKNLDNKKSGISLIVLIITIGVMLILLSIIIVSVSNVSSNAKLSAFASDLSTVEDLTSAYFMQNNSFPTKTENENALNQGEILSKVGTENETAFIEELQLNSDLNDLDELGEFYIIDLTKLDVSSSKKGLEENGENDVYAVSYPSMNIYYLKGEKVKRNMYFSLSSKLTKKVKIDQDMTYSSDNTTTVQSIDGLTVKKINKGWTNTLGIYVQANLASDEELYLQPTGVTKKKLNTVEGNNQFNFNDLAEVVGFTAEESTTFKNASNKKLIFTKNKNNVEIGKIEVDMSNYETVLPLYTIDASNVKYFDEYNTVSFNVTDSLSGIKEVRYEYLTKFDEFGSIVSYYSGITEYENAYLQSKGKRAIPDKNGNIKLKVDKEIQGIQLIIIDKAGNILRTNNQDQILTIGLYNGPSDIYIGLNLVENTDKKYSANYLLLNNNGISEIRIQTSNDGKNYSEVKTINVNSTSSETKKIVSDIQENLGKIKTVKVKAYDNSESKKNYTRIFKVGEKNTLDIGKITNQTLTYNLKTEGTYYNPVIPAGFAPINEGDAIWGTADGWSYGLVIRDEIGNEFVWIPSTESEYAKDYSFQNNYSAASSNTSEDSFLSNLDETLDVKKYGGFYIGRYEATTPDGTESTRTNTSAIPTCQKGKTVWTNISQINSKASAESMYTGENSSVQSGLLTGKAWDRTCHWIEDYIKTINPNSTLNDSRYYGNYNDSQTPANTGTYEQNEKQLSGANDNWKIKNIYDLAGNTWEWTYESFLSYRICRGGGCYNSGSSYPVSYRDGYADPSGGVETTGFRVRLYIKTT
ncbi:MAG: hypothetical protein IJ094_08970 [Bacilli bacterium]|nr:hypothetical protein [Bacilli bacterium]